MTAQVFRFPALDDPPTTAEALATWPPFLDGRWRGPSGIDLFDVLCNQLGHAKAAELWRAASRLLNDYYDNHGATHV